MDTVPIRLNRPSKPARRRQLPATLQQLNVGLVLALVIATVPFVFELDSIIALPGPLRTMGAKGMEIVALGCFAVWLSLDFRLQPLNAPMIFGLFFACHAALTGIWAEDHASYRVHILRLAHVVATSLLLYTAIRSLRDLRHAMIGWKIIAAFVGVLSIIEYWFPGWRLSPGPVTVDPMKLLVTEGDLTFHRAQGPEGHYNWLGFFLGCSLPLQPYFWRQYPSRKARTLLVLLTLVELHALQAGYVRLGVLGAAVGGMWLFVRHAVKRRLVLLGIVAGAAVVALIVPEQWTNRILDPGDYTTNQSVEIRASQQVQILRLLADFGAFGSGYGNFGHVFMSHPGGYASEFFGELQEQQATFDIAMVGAHNVYAEILFEQGLLGLLLFLATGFAAWHGLFRISLRSDLEPWLRQLGVVLEAAFVAIVVMGLVLHIQQLRILWVWLALTAAYLRLTRQQPALPPAATASTRPNALR